jgi:predicted lipoprotein with Yx(FWY)xxD motif
VLLGKEPGRPGVLEDMEPLRSTPLRRRPAALAAAAAATLLLAACGSSSGESTATATSGGATTAAQGGYGSAPAPTTTAATTTQAASRSADLIAHEGKLGTYLVDAQGRPVYLFEKDTSTVSTCSAACTSAWPPVTAGGAPRVGPGLKRGLLGTTTRADGSTQLTYGGHPLYRFAGDQPGGAPTGQGNNGFGAPWYVVRPSGAKLDAS